MRKHRRLLLGTALAGLALRLFFFFHFPAVTDDSRLYADIASNWLQHGVYGQTQAGRVVPTDERLPGYPAFLAAMFALFGTGNLKAALLVQILFDLGTCMVIADLARRTISDRAAVLSFALACACPFLANYAGAALTETLEMFFTVVALDCAVAGLDLLGTNSHAWPGWRAWSACGAAIGTCILLRPDGGILLAAVEFYLLFLIGKAVRGKRPGNNNVRALVRAAALVALLSLAPLAPWTMRNFRTLHHFQPLAPRYATGQEEFAAGGFNRWVKTWIADYSSTEEFYWSMPGEQLDATKLPNRAFDSPAQRDATLALLDGYNQSNTMSRDLDAGFAALAAERIRAHPLRYYIGLPLVRIADMWLRPRTEILPPDPRWWEFDDLPSSSATVIGLGLLNLAYVALASLTLLCRRDALRYLGLLALFLVLRSAFLGSLENPEPRYTLECYPAVIVWAAAYFARPTKQQ